MILVNKNHSNEEYIRLKLPDKKNHELFGRAEQLTGASHIKVVCEDGKIRMTRIPGRMKRRYRIRTGDLVIIKPWEIQDDKADIIYRYTQTQAIILSKRNLLPESLDVF